MFQSLFDCRDKLFIVTGGSGLIGQKIVQGLLDFNAKTVVADLSDKVFHEVEGPKENLFFKNFDVTKADEQIDDLLAWCLDKFGKLNGLIHCAYPRTPDWGDKFEKIKMASWEKNLSMQLGSLFRISQSFCEAMKKNQQEGSLVTIGSTYGQVGPDFSIYEGTEMTTPAAYSAIKGGTINFTRYLASYYGPWGIRVNCLSPGGVFDNQPESFTQKYCEKTPLKRMARPEDLVGAALYLLSDASSYCTGQNMTVDGGWTAL